MAITITIKRPDKRNNLSEPGDIVYVEERHFNGNQVKDVFLLIHISDASAEKVGAIKDRLLQEVRAASPVLEDRTVTRNRRWGFKFKDLPAKPKEELLRTGELEMTKTQARNFLKKRISVAARIEDDSFENATDGDL